MKELTIFLTIIASIFITGCGLMQTPSVYAGYYINNAPDSKASVNVGTSGTQSNTIHAAVTGGTNGANANPEATDGEKVSKGGGAMFINTATGDRSADIDAISAIEKIERARNITAGQSLAATKGDESPASGDQTQNPTQTDSKETNIPVSVGQKAESKTETEPEAGTE